ncbi:MAG: hypothetical protein NWQ13_05010 [Glaciimonas sp.]|nr:hypothetical protein [Glaciimonas sp.]
MKKIVKDEKVGMTYEEYLDEVTTLITEIYNSPEEAAVKYVMRAQAADFFTLHDDHESLRTLENARLDAVKVYETRNKPRPEAFHGKDAKEAKQQVRIEKTTSAPVNLETKTSARITPKAPTKKSPTK